MENIFDFLLNQDDNTKFIIGLVFIIIFYIIFMYIKKRSKQWYSQNKIIVDGKDFFMLKDKVNNIYIYCYMYKDKAYAKWFNDNYSKMEDILSLNNNWAEDERKRQFDGFANEYFDRFPSQTFINRGDELIIRETSKLYIDEMVVYDDYDKKYFKDLYYRQYKIETPFQYYEFNPNDKPKFEGWYSKENVRDKLASITFKKDLDYEKTSEIEYSMNIENKIIEGVFEVIRKPEIEVKQFYLPIEQMSFPDKLSYKYDGLGVDETKKMLTNYLFNFNYPFIRGKEKINMAISGAYNFDERFKQEKGKELEDKLNNKNLIFDIFCPLDYIGLIYYRKFKDFRCLDIPYYDDEVICVYKRTVEVDKDTKKAIVKNNSLIFELDSEKSISSYLKDLVTDSKGLLSKYDVSDYFYNNIDSLIFLLTDTGIIVMPEYPDLDVNDSADEYEEIAERVFISSNDLKEYLNRSHYLAHLYE
ncbi:hypothetical protein E6A47_00550 [Brachyspira pilosicoli]|uniref:hypothetical protein n=1 Tax=Brachyspira pilosicoli TaxID=52584 RepID=UPI001CA4AF5C|nr:hypothetical protein [Brachyspira pilosicoli]MBW5398541.1 hypothetical protein [Brachyspira pilosicoli]